MWQPPERQHRDLREARLRSVAGRVMAHIHSTKEMAQEAADVCGQASRAFQGEVAQLLALEQELAETGLAAPVAPRLRLQWRSGH